MTDYAKTAAKILSDAAALHGAMLPIAVYFLHGYALALAGNVAGDVSFADLDESYDYAITAYGFDDAGKARGKAAVKAAGLPTPAEVEDAFEQCEIDRVARINWA